MSWLPWLLACCWAASAFIAWGGIYASLHAAFPDQRVKSHASDVFFAIVMGVILGPVAIMVVMVESRFRHGLKWL